MAFQPSSLSSLGDAGGSGATTSVDVSDGTGMFRVYSDQNVKLLSGYSGAGKIWSPGSSGYNDVIFNLASYSSANRENMNRVMGTTNVTRALQGSSAVAGAPPTVTSVPRAPAQIARPAAPVSPAYQPQKQPSTQAQPEGITSQVWFWPVVGVTALAVVGGVTYYFYTKSKQPAALNSVVEEETITEDLDDMEPSPIPSDEEFE